MYIGEITAADIVRAQLKDKDFERFVRTLLDAEVELRHRATADVRGPVAPYRRDDKRDLVFIVRDPPRIPRDEFRFPLTWDELEPTWYSCKGGGSWERSFLDELGWGAAKDGKPPGKQVRKRPPDLLLSHLGKGRRLVFVVAEETLDNDAFLDKADKALGYWLDHCPGGWQGGRPGGRPPELRKQLVVIDAHDLAGFIAKHKPSSLGEELRKRLGITIAKGFIEWQEWTKDLGGRELTDFESDAQRDEILAAIGDASRRWLRVFGPPGTGKTRVVHEGIRRLGKEARARVRYSNDPQVGRRLGEWLDDAGGVWIVLDELRTIDVEDIVAKFDSRAPQGARLFLIGTSDDGTRTEPGHAFALGELDDPAIDRVIEHEFTRLGASPSEEQLELVRGLSERYPWYAVLLARALAQEPDGIARGDDDATRWNVGAKRVLADHRGAYGSAVEWEREAELRAKCLLVAMMTRDLELPWDELWEHQGTALARAIGEPPDGHEVRRRELACRHRQILRQSGARAQRRYVSPNNLARLVLNHFFRPNGPDLGPAVRRHVPHLRGSLLDISRAVHAHGAVKELSEGEWQELGRRAREEGVESLASYLSPRQVSYVAAIEAPEASAWGVSQALMAMGHRDLASAPRIRGVLRQVLAHVIHRAIPAEAFLAAEAALLRLAQVDDEPWANNATGVWRSLFLPVLHHTHQPWPLRLRRLDERLAAADAQRRGLAIDALGVAAGTSEESIGHVEDDLRDGPWPRPTASEQKEMKDALWRRLFDACSDPEDDLADRARRAVTGHLRSGIGRCLHAAELYRLATMVSSWTVDQRRVLIEKVADVRRYDGQRLAGHSDLLEGLDALEAALAPTELRERVVVQVGTWTPGPWRIDDEERPLHERVLDRALARELLEAPEDHPWVMTWLLGPQAHRSRAFWRALGFVDAQRVIRDALLPRLRAGSNPQSLSDYLLGWADDEGVDAPERWLACHFDDADLAPAFVGFLVMQDPSEERLAQLQALVSRGAAADGLGLLPYRDWAKALDVEPMLSFVRSLLARDDLAAVALPLIVQLLERDPPDPARRELVQRLEQALDAGLGRRVVIAAQPWFERGVAWLVEAERFDRVVSIIVRALDVADDASNVGMGRSLVTTLLHEGHGERLWPHLAASLIERPYTVLGVQLAEAGILGQLPASLVLDWVGRDSRRACIVAELCHPHQPQLGEVVRELLVRFGPEGAVADALEARACSTPGLVPGGLAQFERQQHEHATRWSEDPRPEVRQWAQRLAESLRRRVDEEDARREFQRRYG